MDENKSQEIVTETFPGLGRRYDLGAGVMGEFSSLQQARVAFTYTMQTHGYQLDMNRTWLKPGFAAVMAP